MGKITLLITVIVLALCTNVYAQVGMASLALGDSVGTTKDFLEVVNYNNEGRGDVFTNKIGDGVINLATCWVDPVRRANEVTEENGVLEGYTAGFGEGILEGVARAVAGTYDTVTFAFPPYEEPMMKPAYSVQDPNKDGLKLVILNW